MKYYTITWRTIDRNPVWVFAGNCKSARSLTEVIAVEKEDDVIAVLKEWMDIPSYDDLNTPWEKVHNDVKMCYPNKEAFEAAIKRYKEADKELREFSKDLKDGVLEPGCYKLIDMKPYIHDPQDYSKYEIEIECLECDGNDITGVLDDED